MIGGFPHPEFPMRMTGFWRRTLCAVLLALPVLASAQTAPLTVFAARA